MTLVYVDASALLRAYFPDEPDHRVLWERLIDGEETVVSSELASVEVASAVRSAETAGRLQRPRDVLARFEADCGEGGRIGLIRLQPETVVPAAYRLVMQHRLRTLDALHLAVAIEECPVLAGDDDVVFVTRDREQAVAAAAVGFVVE